MRLSVVTAPDADTIGSTSPTVTRPMACRNDSIYFSRDTGQLYYQHWYDVHVWQDEQGKTWAEPDDVRVDTPWRVAIRRCAFCSQDYATTGAGVWRCRGCERARRATAQRRRRTRTRMLAATCQHRGAGSKTHSSGRQLTAQHSDTHES
jgi:hypothetical protein